jgi:hypothetical protein
MVKQYLERLRCRYFGGRAEVAQKLHILSNKASVNAHSSVGVLLGEKIGSQASVRVIASSGVGVSLPEVAGGPRTTPGKGGASKMGRAEDKCVDS